MSADGARAKPARALVADDQRDVLEALRLLLRPEGFEIEAVGTPASVVDAAAHRDFDVALVDLNYSRDTTSGAEGLELLRELRQIDPTLPVVVMTAWGSIELAVEAMRQGARDFVQKPWENERLLTILRNQVELGRALRARDRLEAAQRLPAGDGGGRLVAESAAMRPVVEIVARVGPSDAAVLVTGENGTGKGVVARALHAASRRAARPLVHVNIGGLAGGTFESELFGHVRGAFTDAKSDRVGRFEAADGGTLFLDEIGNLPAGLQGKLLRVLETGELERVGSSRTIRVDARLVAATNADLAAEVAAGRFRQDLFFRLNTIEIHLPPLRERREDIPLLASHFLARLAARYRKRLTGFEPAAMEQLLAHRWPGNVRELEHAIERAVLMTTGDEIRAGDLGLRASAGAAASLDEMSLEEVERILIRKALDRHGGNVSQAAEALGLSRSALYRRFRRHGL
ncbi:MAG TPA: sigma-54 dependent transcriptional regulator [Thermoanaerobaculia bacterium]|nr:sigma-54 dependent transcriptional regulator [Thermoanaerobaculia bacterium]